MKSIIDIENISFSYSQHEPVLHNFSLLIPKGERIALLGENGSGKTSLMLMLNGILRPQAGCIRFSGNDYRYSKKELRKLRSQIGFLFCNSDIQLFTPSVREEIAFGLQQAGHSRQETDLKVNDMIDRFQLAEIADRLPLQLSDGQKKKVILAAIVALEPEVLLCDEPTSNLDWKGTQALLHELDRLHHKGKTVLMSTHDTDMALDWASYAIVIDKKEVYFAGTAEYLRTQTDLFDRCGLKPPYK